MQIFLEKLQSLFTLQNILNIVSIQVRTYEHEPSQNLMSIHQRLRSGINLAYYVITHLFHLEVTLLLFQYEGKSCSHSLTYCIVATCFLITVCLFLNSRTKLLNEIKFRWYQKLRKHQQEYCSSLKSCYIFTQKFFTTNTEATPLQGKLMRLALPHGINIYVCMYFYTYTYTSTYMYKYE